MKPRTHRCAATGCQHEIPRHLLMCIVHWRMVPAKGQRAVLAIWRDPTLRLLTVEGVEARSAYRKAVDDVVAALATKQTDKNNARAEVEGDLFLAADTSSGQPPQPEDQHGRLRRIGRTGRGELDTTDDR